MWYIALGLLLMSRGLLPASTSAAEHARPFLIGVLTPSWGSTPMTAGLRDGLLALGYREHEQFDIGVRFTQGNITALPAAAQDLVQYGVDLIIAEGTEAAKVAQSVSKRLPIVFTGASDPVGLGLIHSFARPGGHITGVTELRTELSPKRLELFRKMLPGLQRVFYLYNPRSAASVESASVYREAAHRLAIELREQPVQTEAEAQTLLAQVRPGGMDGIVQPPSIILNIPGFILETAVQRGIPAMFDDVSYVERGALASYGPDLYESGRQAARLVDKILTGASPAEIPVEVNNKIEFTINLKTANALGLTIPPEVLYRAARIIR